MWEVLEAVGLLLLGAVVGWALGRYGGTGARRAGLERAIDVHVERDPRIFESGQPDWIPYLFLFPGPVEQVPSPPDGMSAQDFWAWAHRSGAVDAFSTKLSVTVIARHDAVVAVDALSVDVLDTQPPTGTFVVRPTGGADIVPKGVEIDLEGPFGSPMVSYRNDGGEPIPRLSLRVSATEIERLQIEARGKRQVCRWKAQLHLLVDGRRQTVEVSDDGQPFVTAGVEDHETYSWDGQAWQPFYRPT